MCCNCLWVLGNHGGWSYWLINFWQKFKWTKSFIYQSQIIPTNYVFILDFNNCPWCPPNVSIKSWLFGADELSDTVFVLINEDLVLQIKAKGANDMVIWNTYTCDAWDLIYLSSIFCNLWRATCDQGFIFFSKFLSHTLPVISICPPHKRSHLWKRWHFLYYNILFCSL